MQSGLSSLLHAHTTDGTLELRRLTLFGNSSFEVPSTPTFLRVTAQAAQLMDTTVGYNAR